MNAAARVMEQGSLFGTGENLYSFKKEVVGLVLLLIAILISAFSVVYVKNQERRLFSELQMAQQRASQLHVERGQLLLEQSTWARASRVQRLAVAQLLMHTPRRKNTVLIDL